MIMNPILHRSAEDWRAEASLQHELFRRAVKDGRKEDADIAAREVEQCFERASRALFLDDVRAG